MTQMIESCVASPHANRLQGSRLFYKLASQARSCIVGATLAVALVGGGVGLSPVGILGQIVTFVGAGEVRSGVGTLASPMVGRWEAAGEQDAGRPKGPHPSSLPPPPLRGESASLLVSQNTYP